MGTWIPKELSKLKKRESINNYKTFDIETNAWIDDTYGIDHEEVRKLWHNKKIKPFLVESYDGTTILTYEGKDCIKEFLLDTLTKKNRNIKFFAHNGGKFDFISLYDTLARDKELIERFRIGTCFAQSRMIAMTIFDKNNNCWYFRDSFALLPKSLEKLSEKFKPDHVKQERPPYPFESYHDQWINYCAYDCKALYDVLGIFIKTITDLGGSIGYTIASTAMKTFRLNYLKRPIPTYFYHNDFIRNGYYGGRVEVFNMYAEPTGRPYYYYDCNSEYPYVMKNFKLPTSYPKYVKYETAEECRGKSGTMFCHVKTPPDMHIPILPYRHINKLIFPLGEWDGTYEFSLIEKAIDNGYEITPKTVYEFPESDYIFADYVDDLYSIKEQEQSGALYEIVKLLLNSPYGKTGEKPEHDKLITSPGENLIGAIMYDDVFGYSIKKEKKLRAHQLVGIASRITSLAQLNLYSFIEQVGLKGGTIYYCDTDSVITDVRMDTGSRLGEWKLETDFKEGIFLAPKTYLLDTYEKVIQKMKGISREYQKHTTMEHFKQALPPHNDFSAFNEVRVRPASFKQIHVRKLDGHCFIVQPKTMVTPYDKREIMDDLSTKPWVVKDGEIVQHTPINALHIQHK